MKIKIFYKMRLFTHLSLIIAVDYNEDCSKISITDRKWVNFIHTSKIFLFPAKQVKKGQG